MLDILYGSIKQMIEDGLIEEVASRPAVDNSYLPARRAATSDPLKALRDDR